MDTNQPNPELDMLEALLASMQHQNSGGQLYEDVDDDDDDEYEEDDEDEDEDGYYEHNIQTLLNPYGGGVAGETGGVGAEMGGNGGGGMQLPNMQTMNFLQGLLSMNSGTGLADIEAAIGGSISNGIAAPIDSSAGAGGSFLPSMQSLMPNMNPDVAGALAGAFAGGMGAFMDYGGGDDGNGGGQPGEFEDDEDALSDEEDDDEDDDDDDEDDDDDDDDEDDDEEDDDDDEVRMQGTAPLAGNMMAAAGLLAGAGLASNLAFNQVSRYHHPSHPMLPPNQMGGQHIPPSAVSNQMAFPSAMLLPMSARATCNAFTPVTATTTTVTSSSLASMSGGKVSRVDPLAALAGVGGLALGASILKPIMSSLGNSGGTTVITRMDNNHPSAFAPSSMVSSHPNRSSSLLSDVAHGVTGAIVATKLGNHYNHTMVENGVRLSIGPAPQTELPTGDKRLQLTKLECDDDKASLGSTSSAGSVTSGCGKSDTESVGKKTPTPGQERTDSNHGQGGSCASITDLASATESMRDSDTDNHSESHNATASLSDVDNEILEQHQRKLSELAHFQVGPLPVIIERPTYGWSSLVGLDTAKDALRNLFHARSFPAVFDGSEGSAKGILLFGPSGSGKTTLSRALGKEANNALFVGINSSFLINSHPYEAIKLVRCMFEQARHQKPAVILFDDIDSLCYHPQIYKESAIRAKEEILAQVRGMTTMQPHYPPNTDVASMNDGVLVLGTTNKPWLIEDRLRRLFAYNIHVRLPNDKERYTLFKAFLETLPNRISEPELCCLISKSDGYSAAEINAIIRQTSHKLRLANPNTLDTPPVTYDDVASELTQFGSGYNDELKQKYSAYIQSATHRKEELEDSSKEKKDKPKGVRRFSQRIAKSIAAAVLAVID